METGRRAAGTLSRHNIRDYIQSYLMISPQLIGFLIFTIYPIFWVLRWAWYSYDGVTAEYIGLQNFVRVFTRDPYYWRSVLNSFILSFGKLAVEIPLALILAVILNRKLKGRNMFRTVFFMPNIISVAIIGLIFSFLFASYAGIINSLLMKFGLVTKSVNWFGDKWTAMAVLAIASIWQNFGINMIFFLTALQTIPKELYECSEIDGATKLGQFFHITLPMIAPVTRIILMLAIIGSLKVTDLVLVLTNGEPAGQTEVAMTYVFKYFFSYGESASAAQIGYASSLGVVTAVILGIVTLIYLRMTKKASSIY